MIYVVSYDLAPNLFRNVTPFLQELESTEHGRTWWHFLINTWLISTPETAQQLFARFQPHLLQGSDRLLIIEVGTTYSGFLPSEAWQWIQERVLASQAVPAGAIAVTAREASQC